MNYSMEMLEHLQYKYYNKMIFGLFLVLNLMNKILQKFFLLRKKKMDKIPEKIDE